MRLRRTMSVLLVLVFFLAQSAPGQSVKAVKEDPRVATALELARAWLEGEHAYDQIPGISVAIVHDQELLWSGGFGAADLADGRPAAADTLYSICSISKLFTSTAIMQLRDTGKVRLDDPLQKHLEWFQLKKTAGEGDVTIEGLLTHASGLPRESDYPYWSAPDFSFPTHEQIVKRLSQQDALYPPELHFQYSNLGLTLAGEIVAAASGMPYTEYVQKKILEPLGLVSTTPFMPEAQRGKRLATGYSTLYRDGKRKPVPFFQGNGIAPAMGYASTAEDLARFASWQFRLLKNGGAEVLKATTLREMHRVHWAEPDFETIWGIGYAIDRENNKLFVGHGGSCPGYRTALLLMPEERIATVFMANAQNVDAEGWAKKIYDLVAPAILAASKEPGKGKAPAAELRRYAGTYSEQPWGGEVAVVPYEEGVILLGLPTMEPAKELMKFKLTGPDTFRRVRKDETFGEELVFEMGPDGKPVRFKRHSNYSPRIR